MLPGLLVGVAGQVFVLLNQANWLALPRSAERTFGWPWGGAYVLQPVEYRFVRSWFVSVCVGNVWCECALGWAVVMVCWCMFGDVVECVFECRDSLCGSGSKFGLIVHLFHAMFFHVCARVHLFDAIGVHAMCDWSLGVQFQQVHRKPHAFNWFVMQISWVMNGRSPGRAPPRVNRHLRRFWGLGLSPRFAVSTVTVVVALSPPPFERAQNPGIVATCCCQP